MPPNTSEKVPSSTGALHRTTWFGAVLSFCVFIACAIGIYYLSADARREIDALATANADSTQWALAQSEVELLALLAQTRRADLPVAEQAQSVRRRFDIVYSRVNTMRESEVLSVIRQNEASDAALNDAAAQLDEMTLIVDSSDADLVANLPALSERVEQLRPQVRDISLAGVAVFSEIADAQRTRVAEALFRLGVLTFVLVAALSVVVLALVKSYRTATRDAREKAEAQKQMSVIVSTSLDAIVVVNLDGHVIEFNEAAERIFGYTRAEILNQKMSDKIVPDKYHAAHENGMNRYIETREKRVVGQGRVQLEAKHKTGKTFPVELSISSAEGPHGEIFISYLRDISGRIAKQEELVKARDEAVAGERAKADLVAVMSHEMRTPLNGIVGALELLETTDLDQTQSQMTQVMSTSADMLLQHVNDVLDMSRLEAGAAETIKRPFDPAAVTAELLDSLKMSAQDRGNTLALDTLDPQFNLVLGDPGKLRQILTNLVGNAIKFTKHGTITVEIEPHTAEGQWELRVTDEGLGISDKDQKRIFDDFVTLDPSYTRAQEGTGLGLAIVRRLVDHLGGEIGVESEVGAGSVFWVKLPTHIASDVTSAVKAGDVPEVIAQSDQNAPPMSVLLVEDNAINRIVAREMLTKLGHTCMEAHNGAEAVKLAEMRKFDTILMDISMPDMDGVTATQHIKASDGPNMQTPIFAVTAHAMPADVKRFTEAGMQDVLVKPIGLDRLKALLHGQGAHEDAPTTAVQASHWDSDILADLQSNLGPTQSANLMTLFAQEMDDACQTVFSDFDVENPTQTAADVHKLAGSASILGATKLRALLNQIEEALHADDGDRAQTLAQTVPSVWQTTKDEAAAFQ